jgi:hypothetical protein
MTKEILLKMRKWKILKTQFMSVACLNLPKKMDKTIIKFSLFAVLASLVFGLITSALPANISQKDPVYGYGSDNTSYWNLAGNLAKGLGFMNSPGFDFAYVHKIDQYTFGTQRLPGYPLALAAVRLIFHTDNPKGLAIQLFNLFLVFCNAYFTVAVIKKLLPQVSPAWFWLVVFFPPFLIYGDGIGTDLVTAMLLAGFCHFALKENASRWWAVFFAAWAVFTRANALFFVLPFLILQALFYFRDKKKIILSFAGVLAIALVFIAWSFRNQKLSGSFVYAPYTGQQLVQNYINKIYRYNKPAGEERYSRWQSPAYLKQRYEELLVANQGNLYAAEVKLSNELTKDTLSLFWQRKITALKVYVRDVAQILTNEWYFFNVARTFPSPYVWFGAWAAAILLYTLPGVLFLLVGVLFLWRRKTNLSAILLYSSCLYVLATAAVLGDFTRYVIPVGLGVIVSIILSGFMVKAKSIIIPETK